MKLVDRITNRTRGSRRAKALLGGLKISKGVKKMVHASTSSARTGFRSSQFFKQLYFWKTDFSARAALDNTEP
jgi:hypothetical protein